jgi:ABC-type nitrate/sulfonate/bicarbonate transport system substrate-binding protein
VTAIRISGVPEHFNYPWHLCLGQDKFPASGIDVHWTDVPEGTGKMCEQLRSGETDIALILTEGIVKDIVNGNPSKIVQVYVETPLIWGIHVAANSRFNNLEELENTTAAISRKGSGSQLMAYVNASNQGWDTENLQFETVNTIDGAVDALTNGTADYFMWEHFMTKPLVDKGIFRRIADCPTPWPCFVIAVRDELLEKNSAAVSAILDILNNQTKVFKQIPDITKTLAARFDQKTEDIAAWLARTEWSQTPPNADMLNKVQNQLLQLSLIDKKGTFAEIVKAL